MVIAKLNECRQVSRAPRYHGGRRVRETLMGEFAGFEVGERWLVLLLTKPINRSNGAEEI
jgi:hypothetical protein